MSYTPINWDEYTPITPTLLDRMDTEINSNEGRISNNEDDLSTIQGGETEVDGRISNNEDDISDFKDGTQSVAEAENSQKLQGEEPGDFFRAEEDVGTSESDTISLNPGETTSIEVPLTIDGIVGYAPLYFEVNIDADFSSFRGGSPLANNFVAFGYKYDSETETYLEVCEAQYMSSENYSDGDNNFLSFSVENIHDSSIGVSISVYWLIVERELLIIF